MATNEILRFAETDTGTNLLSQAEYLADTQRLIGNQPGVARSKLVNKVLRQVSLISAGVAEFLAGNQANDITDGLTPQDIASYMEAVVRSLGIPTAVAGGTADAITADFTPNVTLANGTTVIVRASAANTTTTPTFAPDGLTAKTIVKGNNLALAAGDIAGAGHWLVMNFDTVLDKWVLQNPVVTQASDTRAGIVELATAAEVQAGTDATRAVTPRGLAAYAGALSFRNKLINAAFTVNQRLYASGAATTAANQYTLDRWRVVTSGQALSWSGTAPNTTITAPAGGVEQVIEGIWIEGGTYTLSWTGTATATVNGSAVTKGGQVTLAAGANATVRFSGGTVSKPQLELGPYATQFEHRPYGLELMLCQRYYWEARSDTYLQGYAAAAGAATYQKVFFPTIMRVVPTVTASFGAAANATGSIIGTTSDGFTIRAASAASGAYAIMFYSGSNANAEL